MLVRTAPLVSGAVEGLTAYLDQLNSALLAYFAPGFFCRNSSCDQYFVLRDERLNGDGAVAKVPFPKGCRQLRVYCYAWFEKQKEWRVIRDKLCSNGRRKKTFALKATNATIKPFEL